MSGGKEDFITEYPDYEIRKLVDIQKEKSSFSWEDAKNNNISMQMWGDAIEKEVLTESDSGYHIKEANEILGSLEDRSDEEQLDNEQISKESEWGIWDKIVGVFALTMVGSFGIGILRDGVYSVIDIPLRYMLDFFPYYVVIIILASSTSILSVWIQNRIDSNSEHYKSEIRDIRQEVSVDEDTSMINASKEVSQKQSKKLMNLQINLMKDRIRPILWTVSITIPIIIWLIVTSNTAPNISTVSYPLFGEHFWSGEVWGPIRTWIPLYVVCSLLFSQFVEKLFY